MKIRKTLPCIVLLSLVALANVFADEIGLRSPKPSTSGLGRSYNRWYFSPQAVKNAYEYQEFFGRRLPNRFTPENCFYGGNSFPGWYQGKTITIPCEFFIKTKEQLKQLTKSGQIRYLFPLDVDHADLAIPTEKWESTYRHMASDDILQAMLKEPTLVTIIRTRSHFEEDNPPL